MISAPKPKNENLRLQALKQLDLLDTLSESEYDQIVEIASQICDTPIALISLVDQDRQWFKAKVGLSATETPRDLAFCAHAILQEDVFVVEDSSKDPRFFDNPLVTGAPHVQFYAGAPIKSPEGLPIGTVCVIDHNQRKLTEKQISALKALSNQVTIILNNRLQIKELKKTQAQLTYKTIAYENLIQGVVLQDRTGAIIEFNPVALKVLDLTADELTGKTSMDPDWGAIKEDGTDFPGNEHPAMVCLKTGQPIKNVVMGVKSRSRGLRWIRINSNPLFLDSEPTPSHSVTSFADITEYKKFEHERQQFQIQLTEAERLSSLGQMAGGVAHEINNPLAIIRGKAELLKRRIQTGQVEHQQCFKDIEMIEATVDRIAKIVKGMRNYSRNAENDPFEQTSVRTIINDTLELCNNRISSKQIVLSIDCPDEINFDCRPAQISQILLNLISNSIDAIENLPQKWIKIEVTQKKSDISLTVTDSGNGIEASVANSIMTPFFTTKPVGKGTGLGLSISKGIANAHGGKLQYLSDLKNTTFELLIPVNQNHVYKKSA